MLNVRKMIESAEACMGWPYVSPGTNDSRGIDCSGLFVKIFRDQGMTIYHGSNTIYRKYCSETGKLENVSQLKPGMAVFKWNANTPERFGDGLGDFQHIGLVVSVNPLRIIHASSAAGCVTADTKIGKWRYWGWLEDAAKEDGSAPVPEPEPETPVPQAYPMLKKGCKGNDVAYLQSCLIMLGYDIGNAGVDGDFGSKTLEAVKNFQADRGLTVDGIVGPKTWDALENGSYVVQDFYTVTIMHLPKATVEEITARYGGVVTKE